MKKTNRIISVLLTFIMLLSIIPVGMVSAGAASKSATINVESVSAVPGSTVEVDIEIKDNPGILGATLELSYGKGLTLTNAVQGEAWDSLVMTKPGKFASPCKFAWDGQEISADQIKDGVILTLTFEVAEDATSDTELPINISYEYGDVADANLDFVTLDINNGQVTVIDYTPGDLDGNGKVNSLDVIYLRRYITGGYDVVINTLAANVNRDSKINTLDVIAIRRFIAGGYNDSDGNPLVLWPSPVAHTHDLIYVPAKEATTTEEGNIAYWYCAGCGKYFSDSVGKNEVKRDDVLIPVIDANSYTITYNLVNNDNYLAGQSIVNPNKTTYTAGKGFVLSNDLNVPGYTFVGWFDSFADNATQIKSISGNEERNITLYAHWEPYKYKIQFESDLIQVNDDYYTVNQSKTLPSPKISGYSFVGWSDDDGNIIKRIPIGTTGNKTYTANWLSDRNQAITYKNVSDPIILEEDNKILFAYEVGEIRNVPVSVIHDFGKIVGGGVASEQTVTHSKTVSESEVKNYAKTVANATTENYGITLSNGWSDGMTVSEEYCKQNGITQEEARSQATNETNNWYVSSGKSGSTTTTSFNTTDTTDMLTGTSNKSGTGSASYEGSKSSTHTEENHSDFSFEESINASGKIGPVKVGGQFKANQSFGSSESDSTTESSKMALGSSVTVGSGTSHQGGTVSHTGSNTSSTGSWNTESGRSGSNSVTNTVSTAKIISESISEKTGYGKSYIQTGSETSNQGFSSQQSSSDSYSTGITYSTSESETYTETISTTNTIEGYHRWVWATTAHVFMIVGYDIATSSYFTCNYSILDENNVKRFEDYSYDTASYDDNQTSVINFEIPTDIKDYVADKISGSEGLQFSRDGKVTGYTGTDDFVIIPEYKVINGTVIKVTGIAKNAFKGKVKLQNGTDEFLGIELSEYITEIEDGAFEGCSALKYINFKNVTSIGENAFAGCESLKVAQLNDNVTHLGDNAFENLDALLIYAANKSVAESAVKSGAKAIALIVSDKCADFEDVTLEVPTGTGFFGFYGSNSTPRNFKDVSIVSNADETLILNANFEFTKNNPITISSETVTWGESNVYSPYFCVMFTSENTNLSVYGESTFYSQKGDAILTRDLTLSGIEDELYSQYHMNGNVLVCGEVTDNGNLSFISGQVITISEDEFTKYLKGTYIVTFDPNGGMVDTDSKTIFFGSEYGELPIPTRDGCEFLGWYQGDTQITSDMIPTKAEDVTLKARWQSSWVLAENLPADGQTNDDKWSYTEREYSNSGSSTMTGWTKYDTKRTSWGATQGPVYSNPNNGSRNVWSEQYKIRDNYKTVWHYSRSITGPSGWNSYSVNISPNEGYLAYTQYITLDYQLSLYDENWKGLGKRYGQYYHDGFDCPYWFNEWSESVYVNTDYGTRWYYQDPIYTYYYYRDVDKESTSEITAGGDISNVQHWVKYIVK